MLSHAGVWAALDALAEKNGLSASGLAKKAGLDSTAFNRSKRQSADGRPRWPSTESISKVLVATATPLDVFMKLLHAGAGGTAPARVPLLGVAQAGAGGFFDDAGFPVGQGLDIVDFPVSPGEGVYALEVTGDSMLPVYRDGDRLIVQPGARVRKGDRVVVRTSGGEVMAKVLARQGDGELELASLNPEHPPRTLPLDQVDWIARILWASQ
ncbi:DNA-binding protein [Zhengella mangrovi]|uniref:DNA-binding protein n=1 Tax=Zhengella mangrovi TaxID=1982044 RepID=A0A2G1QJ21_9HYPH|nr:helix-turn-helix transcriptional regulator [Zhengella mangrovi]PHP65489.1 DNA-binding protein [Zhengella mangrovi]